MGLFPNEGVGGAPGEQEAAEGRAVVHRTPHDVPHGGTFCHSSTRTGASSRVSRCGPARRALAGPGGQIPALFYAW